jgi:hypothetical protein
MKKNKQLVKCKICLENNGSNLVFYYWERTFLCFGKWHALGVHQEFLISENQLSKITNESVSQILCDTFLFKK